MRSYIDEYTSQELTLNKIVHFLSENLGKNIKENAIFSYDNYSDSMYDGDPMIDAYITGMEIREGIGVILFTSLNHKNKDSQLTVKEFLSELENISGIDLERMYLFFDSSSALPIVYEKEALERQLAEEPEEIDIDDIISHKRYNQYYSNRYPMISFIACSEDKKKVLLKIYWNSHDY